MTEARAPRKRATPKRVPPPASPAESGQATAITQWARLGTWRGLPKWECRLCAFDTLDGEQALLDHVIERHWPKPPAEPKQAAASTDGESPAIIVADRWGNPHR